MHDRTMTILCTQLVLGILSEGILDIGRGRASLMRELVYRTTFATRTEARTTVFRYIEVWYNRKRRHSSLGYVSPEQFEQQYQQQRLMAA